MPGLNPNGRVNLAALERHQEYFLRSGKQSQRVDYTRFVDKSCAGWAAQQFGDYPSRGPRSGPHPFPVPLVVQCGTTRG